MGFNIDKLVRDNIKKLVPYSSARSEFAGSAEIFIDANENSFGSPLAKNYSRYPDPLQTAIKEKIAAINGVQPAEIFVGNGSDEAIDLLFRIFCRPWIDNVLICPPTYGMYEVSASINEVAVKRANLTETFALNVETILTTIDQYTKLIYFCSPNNPTGNLLSRKNILQIARSFTGIVVVDEAYIHFSGEASLVSQINETQNLVVLQTFSKAWGLAGLRVGLAFANTRIIALFNKVKPPYNVCQVAQELVISALDNRPKVEQTISQIITQRKELERRLSRFSFVTKIFPSDANFLLVKTTAPIDIYQFLLDNGIVVRNRSSIALCEGCLRITVGTAEENKALIESLKKYEESIVH